MSEITAENSFEEIWDTIVFKSVELLEYSKEVKTTRTKILLLLQKHIQKLIPYKCETIGDLPGSINQLLFKAKFLVLANLKNTAIDKMIEKLPLQESKDDIKLSRHKAMEFRDSGKTDHLGEFTIFGQIHQLSLSN